MTSPRMQRWALTLSGYQYKLTYIPGRDNVVANALSRLPIVEHLVTKLNPGEVVHFLQNLSSPPMLSRHIRQWTERDPLLSKVKRAVQWGWPRDTDSQLRPYSNRQKELSIQCGCLLWGNRVVIPPQGRRRILKEVHDTHPGIVKMKALARSYVWWPNVDREIEETVSLCPACQAVQKTPPKVPLQPWSWPDSPWKRIHIYYFGPFWGQMFLIVVDAHSKWIEVHPTGNSSSALTTIRNLRRLFSTYGIPEMIVSNNGTSFTGHEFKHFTKGNGIRHLQSATKLMFCINRHLSFLHCSQPLLSIFLGHVWLELG